MTKRQMQQGRMSNALVVVLKPCGPHHCAKCLGSVHTVHTRSRGASNTRVPMIDRESLSRSRLFLALTLRLLRLQFFQIVSQAIETLVPEAAILPKPVVNVLE